MRLCSRWRVSRKYPGSVCVPSQTIKNRARGDREAGRRRNVSRRSRLDTVGLEAKQKCVGVDEGNCSVPALQIPVLEILLAAWLEIAQRVEMARRVVAFLRKPDLVSPQNSAA